jgi:hypothetical protein
MELLSEVPEPTPSLPSAPLNVSAAAGNASATVSFSVPADDGGATITSYTATSNPGALSGSCAASPCLVEGLSNGTAYTFTVSATNEAGQGPDSDSSNAVTPNNAPPGPEVTFLQLLDTVESMMHVTTGHSAEKDGLLRQASERQDIPKDAEPIPVIPTPGFFLLSGLLGLLGIRRLANR